MVMGGLGGTCDTSDYEEGKNGLLEYTARRWLGIRKKKKWADASEDAVTYAYGLFKRNSQEAFA
jgi:hypothetical protein